MSKSLTTAELANMNETDLLREIAQQRQTVTKIRLGLQLGKEKGSHHLRVARTSLARMLTALARLHNLQKFSRIPAPAPVLQKIVPAGKLVSSPAEKRSSVRRKTKAAHPTS